MTAAASPEIIPVTGIKDAIRWREALAEAIANLIRDYEKRVPHVQVESLVLRRVDRKTHVGTRYKKLVIEPRVVLNDTGIVLR